MNNEKLINTPKRLNHLAFLKFLAMAFIILWHVATLPNKPFDIGARMCEFLIVASGFLVGYNHFHKQMPCTFKQSFKYLFKHFRTYYPLHIICLVLLFFLNFTNNTANFNMTSVENLFANIFLIQSWSSDSAVVFSYNGISWFLSVLTLCYFLSPFLLKFIKNVKISLLAFFAVLVIRLLAEYFIVWGGDNIFNIWFHANPVIKLLEFFLGMLIVPLFYFVVSKIEKISNKIWFSIVWTLVEIALPAGMWFFMLGFSKYLIRGIFVLFFCACVFVSAINAGYISKFFGLKIPSRVLGYQMEAFMFHIVTDYALTKVMRWTGLTYPNNYILEFLIIFTCNLVLAGLYHEFLNKHIAKGMDKLANLVRKCYFALCR